MKKTFKLSLILAPLCLLLAACNSHSNDAPSTSSPTAGAPVADSAPITIGYSDWPGWTCWDIVEQQGFFKKHGVNVSLKWFPNYSDSLSALAAGQVDANCQTWSDTMGPLAAGQPLKVVLVNDNSAGNDAMIAKAGINSVKDLKGKKIATELGTCDHYLMLKALEANGLKETDVTYVNTKVQDCPAAMIAGNVDAAVVWEPSRSSLLHSLKGSKVVYDSLKTPGLIPDLLVFQAKVSDARKADVQKIVDAWYDMMDWWKAHPDEAVKIMAKRTDSPVAFYNGFIKGTRIFSAPEAMAALTKSDKITSLYTSGGQIAQFLLNAKQINKIPDFAAAIDPEFTQAALGNGTGKTPPYTYSMTVSDASSAK